MATLVHQRHDVDALKRAYPLVDVVATSGVRLVRAGPSSLKGCCPFHDDRTPSLVIDERDQHFHCYGCRAHGDVISWVMRRDGLSFTGACDLWRGYRGRHAQHSPWLPGHRASASDVGTA